MTIELFATPSVTDRDILKHTVIVIDVLRATSSIVTAFENGCRSVIPVTEVEEAVAMARSLGDRKVLLCGERNAVLIPGFNLSNSPLEYTRERVEGKTLVMSTTNGTRALNLVRASDTVLLGSMLNAAATAKRALLEGRPITIVCAGTEDRFSLDDILAAGCIIEYLKKYGQGDQRLCDLSRTALTLYRLCREDMKSALGGSVHFKTLKRLGLNRDLDFCLRENAMRAVPVYTGGVIRLNESHTQIA